MSNFDVSGFLTRVKSVRVPSRGLGALFDVGRELDRVPKLGNGNREARFESVVVRERDKRHVGSLSHVPMRTI